MWLSDRRSPPSSTTPTSSALASASEYLRMKQLRARIKKRSYKYGLYKSKRKDLGSERVDWEFVGFPSSSSGSASTAFFEEQPQLNFEPLRRKPASAAAAPAIEILPGAAGVGPASASSSEYMNNMIDFAQLARPTPPPVPPRTSGARSKRPPPPRPSSLYARLTPSVHPTEVEYSQVQKPARRKRPRSSDLDQQPPTSQPPPLPPHMDQADDQIANLAIPPVIVSRPLPSVPPHSSNESKPARLLHGSGVPIPLPNSPPAPPPPPHASPNPVASASNLPAADPLLASMASLSKSSLYNSLASSHRRGRNSTLDSPFYQRPMSLRSRLSSLARSLSPPLITDQDLEDENDDDIELLELFFNEGKNNNNPGRQQETEISIEPPPTSQPLLLEPLMDQTTMEEKSACGTTNDDDQDIELLELFFNEDKNRDQNPLPPAHNLNNRPLSSDLDREQPLTSQPPPLPPHMDHQAKEDQSSRNTHDDNQDIELIELFFNEDNDNNPGQQAEIAIDNAAAVVVEGESQKNTRLGHISSSFSSISWPCNLLSRPRILSMHWDCTVN